MSQSPKAGHRYSDINSDQCEFLRAESLNPLKRVIGILMRCTFGLGINPAESQSPKAGHRYSDTRVALFSDGYHSSLNPLKRVIGILINVQGATMSVLSPVSIP